MALMVFSLISGACATNSNIYDTQNNIDVFSSVWVGDEFEISLDENSGSGYQWYINIIPGGMELLNEEYHPPNNRDTPGSRQFIFKNINAGDYELKFTLVHPSDKETPYKPKPGTSKHYNK